jgi:uncharacterized damage-inducible protein DinB
MVTTGELANYRDYLDHYRATLRRQCEGLTAEQLARRSVPPSTLSLLGLVRHMAYVEHAWFQRVLQGKVHEERPFTDPGDPDVEFTQAVGTQECVAEARASWGEQIALADTWLDAQDDQTLGLEYVRGAEKVSARDVLVHMIEEYARHCGHADLLRECIDGRTGQ